MSVQSIDRTFDILELMARQDKGMTLTEIAEQIDLPKSTVHRLLAVLRERNYIEKNDSSSLYRLGLEFIELCSGLLNSLELKTEAQPELRRLSLQTGQVVFLAIEQEGELVYIDKIDKFNEIRSYCFIGQRRPLYCTGLGKALLTGRTNEEIRELINEEQMVPYTNNTLTSINALIEDVAVSRQRGYSIDNEEVELGMRCVAAAIKDYRNTVIAAVSTSWDIEQYDEDMTIRNAGYVKEAAHAISLRMGCRSRTTPERSFVR